MTGSATGPAGVGAGSERHTLFAVNLKTYLDAAASERWCLAVRDIARSSPAVSGGSVSLAVLPAMPLIAPAVSWFRGSPVLVGGQDVSAAAGGPHTGETPAALLAELGCRLALAGHAERRRAGDTDEVVARKVRRSLEAGLLPLVCVGEGTALDPAETARVVVEQLERSLADVPAGRLIVAYEPLWAIGAAEPAGIDLIGAVCGALDDWLRMRSARAGSLVLYGGSAGPDLLPLVGGTLHGLFLGRSVHDPAVLAGIVRQVSRPTSS